MTRTAIQKVKDKDKLFKIWRSSREGVDNKKYIRARNQAKWECRRADADLRNTDGHMVTDPKEKANLMNSFFTSVLTEENVTSMPEFDQRPFAELLKYMAITAENVVKKLEKLNPTKSPGPD